MPKSLPMSTTELTPLTFVPLEMCEPSLFPDQEGEDGVLQFRPANVRRRPHTAPAMVDMTIFSRDDRLRKRNRAIVARYYYWTELLRRRWDDVERILANNEFFLDARTIASILVDNQGYFNQLVMAKTTREELASAYAGFDFS